MTPDWTMAVSWLVYGFGAVDVLWMIRDLRKQTLHDKLAGTFVVAA